MRTIKFRGLRTDNGEWVYGSLVTMENLLQYGNSDTSSNVHIIESGDLEIRAFRKGCEVWTGNGLIQVHTESVGQFTGHKDKNGVEIYEGDIISSYRGKRTVEYTPSDGIKLAIIYDEPPNGISQTHEDFRYNSTSISSVIGNIHTTPELLNN